VSSEVMDKDFLEFLRDLSVDNFRMGGLIKINLIKTISD